jgi:hypothetical protein
MRQILLRMSHISISSSSFSKVIANSAVQTYTTELWKGGIGHWPGWKIFFFLFSFAIFPPVWLVFSLPLDNKYNKTPIVKFGGYLTSHFFFMAFQIITSCIPIYPIYRQVNLYSCLSSTSDLRCTCHREQTGIPDGTSHQ